MATLPAPAAVHALLVAPDTRAATLAALESHPDSHAPALAIAVAPALTHLMTVSADDVDAATYQRVGALLARLYAEASDDMPAVHAAALGDGRWVALFNAEDSALVRALRKPADELTADDALTYACSDAWFPPAAMRGYTRSIGAIFSSIFEWYQMLNVSHPANKVKMPADETAIRMMTLLMQLLRAPPSNVPRLVLGGALLGAQLLSALGRRSVAQYSLESGFIDLYVSVLNEIGPPSEWLSISRSISNGTAGLAGQGLHACGEVLRAYGGAQERPDKAAYLESGLFDLCLGAISAFEQRGHAAAVADTDHQALWASLSVIVKLSDLPTCRQKIRGVASALSFCIDPRHDLDHIAEIGSTTAPTAAYICARVFGRVRSS